MATFLQHKSAIINIDNCLSGYAPDHRPYVYFCFWIGPGKKYEVFEFDSFEERDTFFNAFMKLFGYHLKDGVLTKGAGPLPEGGTNKDLLFYGSEHFKSTSLSPSFKPPEDSGD